MHETAVTCSCALLGYYLWRDAVELVVAWYSGAAPPLQARTRAWIWLRGAVGAGAIATALATL